MLVLLLFIPLYTVVSSLSVSFFLSFFLFSYLSNTDFGNYARYDIHGNTYYGFLFVTLTDEYWLKWSQTNADEWSVSGRLFDF